MSSETPSDLITSLPQELVVDILARVPSSNYPTLFLVSKYFRSLVASPKLHARRSSLGYTEHCLYISLYNTETRENRLYILCRGDNSSRLVLIPRLPAMPSGENYLAVGSKIYVLGENIRVMKIIDCRSHTENNLPYSPTRMTDTVAGIIDGKIYVIGAVDSETNKVMVFDTETQMWEPGMTKPGEFGYLNRHSCAVMADKMYMSDTEVNSFVYTPNERRWETDGMLSIEAWEYACVVDDILYYYDDQENELKAYDPKHRCWTVVEGLKDLLCEGAYLWVSCGGKLVVFFRKTNNSMLKREIWCAEIAFERCRGEEIWGKVEWCDVVIDGPFIPIESLAVMV